MARRLKAILCLFLGGLCVAASSLAWAQDDTREMHLRANDHFKQGQHAEAVALLEQAVQLRMSQGLAPEHVAFSTQRLVFYYRVTGQLGDAVNAVGLVESYFIETLGDLPDSAFLFVLAKAELWTALGRFADAERFFEDALEKAERQGAPPYVTTAIRRGLAAVYSSQGRFEASVDMYRAVLESTKAIYEPDHGAIGVAHAALGGALRAHGKAADAEKHYLEAQTNFKSSFGPLHYNQISVLQGLGGVYMDGFRYDQARPVFERALEIVEKSSGPESMAMVGPLRSLATLELTRGDAESSIGRLERALAIQEAALGEDHLNLSSVLCRMGGVYGILGQPEKARSAFARCASLDERRLAMNLSVGGESQKRAFMKTLTTHRVNLESGPLSASSVGTASRGSVQTPTASARAERSRSHALRKGSPTTSFTRHTPLSRGVLLVQNSWGAQSSSPSQAETVLGALPKPSMSLTL